MPKIANSEVDICEMYLKHGKCTWGKSCKFAHINADNVNGLTKKNTKPCNTGKNNASTRKVPNVAAKQQQCQTNQHNQVCDSTYNFDYAEPQQYSMDAIAAYQYQMWVFQQASILAAEMNACHITQPSTKPSYRTSVPVTRTASAPPVIMSGRAAAPVIQVVVTKEPTLVQNVLDKTSLDANTQQYYDQTQAYLKGGLRSIRKFQWLSSLITTYVTGCGISIHNMKNAIIQMENRFTSGNNNGHVNTDEYYQAVGFLKAIYATFN